MSGTRKGQSAIEVMLLLALVLLVVAGVYSLVTGTKSVTQGNVTMNGTNMTVQQALNSSLNDLRNVSTMPEKNVVRIGDEEAC